MKIGEVSAILDIPASTIRYYERVGLFPAPNRVSGQRNFNTGDITMLRFIKLAQVAGFSIKEIKDLSVAYKCNQTPAPVWTRFATKKQQVVQRQLEGLIQVQTILSSLLDCKCESFLNCIEAADEQGILNADECLAE